MSVVPCIVCRKELEAMDSGSPNHADDANEFHTYGQYGSTVFDPMDSTFLAVNICDRCLVDAANNGRVLQGNASGPRPLSLWSAPERR